MKSHHPPNLKKIFKPQPTAKEIEDSYHRARMARGSSHRDALKPEEPGAIHERT